ncbi:MAG: hypothetical protein JZD41_07560 [Thermoproteus sp.]|nr:hypothetical protein [Thermoproteus sp.]
MSEKIQAQNVLEFSSEFLEQVKREAEVRDVEWAIDQLRNRLQEYYNALEPLRLVLVNKKGIWLPSRSGEEDGDAVYTDAIIDVFCKNYFCEFCGESNGEDRFKCGGLVVTVAVVHPYPELNVYRLNSDEDMIKLLNFLNELAESTLRYPRCNGNAH